MACSHDHLVYLISVHLHYFPCSDRTGLSVGTVDACLMWGEPWALTIDVHEMRTSFKIFITLENGVGFTEQKKKKKQRKCFQRQKKKSKCDTKSSDPFKGLKLTLLK